MLNIQMLPQVRRIEVKNYENGICYALDDEVQKLESELREEKVLFERKGDCIP